MTLTWDSTIRFAKFFKKLASLKSEGIFTEDRLEMNMSKAIMPLGDKSVFIEILVMISVILLLKYVLEQPLCKIARVVSSSFFNLTLINKHLRTIYGMRGKWDQVVPQSEFHSWSLRYSSFLQFGSKKMRGNWPQFSNISLKPWTQSVCWDEGSGCPIFIEKLKKSQI